MSTMRVTNLKHENSASNNIVLNADGSVGGDLATTLASKLDLAGGKILQIVRATDSSTRSTTSTSFVDVTGMSVTITPQKSDSALLVIASYLKTQAPGSTEGRGRVQITDSSNNAISGAEGGATGNGNLNGQFNAAEVLVAYATPATTSAVTYKLRFNTLNSSSQITLANANVTGQLFAIEVSA